MSRGALIGGESGHPGSGYRPWVPRLPSTQIRWPARIRGQSEGGAPATQIPRLGMTGGRKWSYVGRGQLTQDSAWTDVVAVGDVVGRDSSELSTNEN